MEEYVRAMMEPKFEAVREKIRSTYALQTEKAVKSIEESYAAKWTEFCEMKKAQMIRKLDPLVYNEIQGKLKQELRTEEEPLYKVRQVQLKKEFAEKLKAYKENYPKRINREVERRVKEVTVLKEKEIKEYYKGKLNKELSKIQQDLDVRFQEQLGQEKTKFQTDYQEVLEMKKGVEKQLSRIVVSRREQLNKIQSQRKELEGTIQDLFSTNEALSPQPEPQHFEPPQIQAPIEEVEPVKPAVKPAFRYEDFACFLSANTKELDKSKKLLQHLEGKRI